MSYLNSSNIKIRPRFSRILIRHNAAAAVSWQAFNLSHFLF